MSWDEREWDRDILAFYRSLIRLRREEPGLREGARETVHLDAGAGTYAYVRAPEAGSGGYTVLAAFNMSEEERTIRVSSLGGTGEPVSLLTTGSEPRLQSTTDGVSVTLAPMSAAIVGL
jgi:glycosidase